MHVILSEAKDLSFPQMTGEKILRFAQDDNFLCYLLF
jgi:hypothetical protein